MRQAIRRAQRLGLLTFLVLAGLMLLAGAANAATWDRAEGLFVEKINASRKASNLAPLGVDGQLVRVARDWTPRMVSAGQISHRPDLAQVVSGNWERLGENVGRSLRPDATEAELVERLHTAFMESPGHRANILGNFNYVGVGVTVSSDGAMWVTVNFMLLPAGTAPTPPPPSSSTSSDTSTTSNTSTTSSPTTSTTSAPPASPTAINEAVRISQQVFAAAGQGGRQAEYAVVGRAEVFADVLGGSGLAGDKAPVLFTNGPRDADRNPGVDGRTRAEIDRVLGGKGTVYLLGGPNAVSERVAQDLASAGYDVRRLAGSSRVETSVRVAEEIVRRHGAPARILLARADDWPDAVSGGAYAAATSSPLVLTGSDALHPAVQAFLSSHGGAQRFALGGKAALADAVVTAARATRISGPDRTATAVAVAERLWGRTAGKTGDRYASTPGWGNDAWAYALAMAPWSAANDGPQLLVADHVPGAVSGYLGGLGYSGDVRGDVFSASVVSASVVKEMRTMVGGQ